MKTKLFVVDVEIGEPDSSWPKTKTYYVLADDYNMAAHKTVEFLTSSDELICITNRIMTDDGSLTDYAKKTSRSEMSYSIKSIRDCGDNLII
jgi:predicted glycosyl hydrolase (DUF1957 family)